MSNTPARLPYVGACLLLAVSTSFSTAANAGAGVWTNSGPDARVTSIAIDPKTPSTLYAVAVDRVFKSTEWGGTWGISGDIGIRAYYYSALAIDPSTPSTLYVGTNNCCLIGSDSGLSKSTNGGASWAKTGLGSFVNALAIDPLTPSTLYAGGYGVFKSTDAGGSWTPVNTGLNATTSVLALVIDPSSPSTVFAGTSAGVFKTSDGGSKWSAVNAGLTNLKVSALVINPANPSTIYAGTSGGVFRSTDSGRCLVRRQWRSVGPGGQLAGHQSRQPLHHLRRDIRGRLQVRGLRGHLVRSRRGPARLAVAEPQLRRGPGCRRGDDTLPGWF